MSSSGRSLEDAVAAMSNVGSQSLMRKKFSAKHSHILTLSALLLAVATLWPLQSLQAANDKVKGVEAKQVVYVLGNGTVLASSLGLKWNSNKSKTMVLCCPPDWKIRIFNQGNRSYFETSIDKFTGFYFKEVTACGGMSVNRLSFTKAKETNYKGRTAALYKSSEAYKKSMQLRYAKKNEYFWEPSYGELITLRQENSLPPQVIEALARLYGLPPRTNTMLRDLPVQLKVVNVANGDGDYLLTPSITERLISKSEYAAPADYLRKNTFNEVITEESSALKELF